MNTEAKPLAALFRPALVLMTGRMLGFVMAFAIPMVLARVFDQTEFGTYKQLFLIFGTLFGIAQLGMAESLYYFLPSRGRDSGRFVFNTLATATVLGLACLFGLWLFRFELAGLMNNPALADLILPVGLYLLFMLMAVVLEIIMTIRRQFRAASATYAATDLARAIFYLTPVLLFADLRALMVGAVVFALARFLVTLVYVRREFGPELRPDRSSLSEQARYAVPFGLAGMIEVAQANFHMYAVSHAFDAATFAIYAVGCLQIPIFDFLMTSTSNVMMVNMRERLLEEDSEGAVAVWLDGNRKLAMIFFPLVAGLLVMAQPFIVLLFTDTYAASVPIFMVWTGVMLLATLLTDSALRVFALTRFLIVQNLVSLALVVLLVHVFIEAFGLIGAVLVTLLADTVVKVMALLRVRRALKVETARLLPWRALVITAALSILAALPALGVTLLLDAHELIVLMVSGPIFLLSYAALLHRFGPLEAEERAQLGVWVQKRLAWLRRTSGMAPGN
ncbi:MAG: oligosaccharide flippase family protein [Xanthomonadales bacterium]|jgi:O-antigen/teichoic acid export membrane protein|nr:oligosaccharide flippase family protein [Xanthomonadales bacterium]